MVRRPPRAALFPYTALFRAGDALSAPVGEALTGDGQAAARASGRDAREAVGPGGRATDRRSEEHTPELQPRQYPACRPLLGTTPSRPPPAPAPPRPATAPAP